MKRIEFKSVFHNSNASQKVVMLDKEGSPTKADIREAFQASRIPVKKSGFPPITNESGVGKIMFVLSEIEIAETGIWLDGKTEVIALKPDFFILIFNGQTIIDVISVEVKKLDKVNNVWLV